MQKSYLDFMKEITPDRLYHGLLAHGLFTEKLPPFLTSVNFFDYCQSRTRNFPDVPSTYIYYESMREINVPRQLGIPNPIAYQHLCKCLSENWYKICEHFEKYTSYQTYKTSRIHIRKLASKQTLFEMNYSRWDVDGTPEPDLMIGKKYLVKSDIATFFPNIYTHALPWALVGKPEAKINMRKNIWYNDIDRYARNTKHGETHGLLIGPHASNLLSEIILTVVDYNLYQKGKYCYIRHVDDYICYVDTHEEAKKFIVDLSDELRKFDLVINHRKTSISELPLGAIENWVRQINAIKIKPSGEMMNFIDVRAYLDNVIEIMHNNNKLASVLKYAIKVLSNQKMSDNAKIYFTKTILHSAIIFPYLIPLLDEYIFVPLKTNHSIIEYFTNLIFGEGKKFKNDEEICFSLFFSLKYNIIIKEIDDDYLLKTDNCIVYMLSYLYFSRTRNREACKKLRNHALKLSLQDEDFGQFWVFIYEVLPQSSLKGEWKDMKKNKVSFLKAL
jgi:hypothetical protein